MATKTLMIKELVRTTNDDQQEILEFSSGVNVLVGRPNTGKSKWLAMLDFLFGDRGSPEKAFGKELAEKYSSISATIIVDGEELVISRNWKLRGLKTKITVGNESLDPNEFSQMLLEKLGIPELHFPKGNPYRGSWPVLSWRTLFRHIYRQQRFWSDFADKQPELDQHACLMLFTGIAEYLYSDQYGELIKKRKKIFQLEATRDEHQRILDEISRDLVGGTDLEAGITEQSIGRLIRRLREEMESLQIDRDATLRNLLEGVIEHTESKPRSDIESLGESWTNLQLELEDSQLYLANLDRRLSSIVGYQTSLTNETEKVGRANTAASIFGRLRITNCPACDQLVKENDDDKGHCFLCHQTLPDIPSGNQTGEGRLKAEVKHLQAEKAEIGSLVASLSKDREIAATTHRRITEDLSRVENQLNTVRRSAASIVSPDLSVFDMEIGRTQERIRQLERIRGLLNYRTEMASEIKKIQDELSELELEVNNIIRYADFSFAEDALSDGMTTYLNALNASGRVLWDLGRVKWHIKEKSFDVSVGDSSWTTKLGGTLTLYFLLAYHFALLSLTNTENCHYPGLVVLDFQAKLEDGTVVKDEENFVLEPFVDLISEPGFEGCQIIAAGAAFEGLEGANRVELDHVWA